MLSDNSAVSAGGALYNGMPWGLGSNTTATIIRCKLTSNSVTGYNVDVLTAGGAIWNGSPGASASLTITETALNGNFAPFGGAVFIVANGDSGEFETDPGTPAETNVSIVRSSLIGNAAVSTLGNTAGAAIVQLWGQNPVTTCTLTVDNSTLADNSAVAPGPGGYGECGAILNFGAQLNVNNCTVTGNDDTWGASGISSMYGLMYIKNTILANSPLGANLVSDDNSVISNGYNLSSDDGSGFLTAAGDMINTDPLLGPLADYGGPTWTCAPLFGSPAIDAADSTDIDGDLVTTDQRGVSRPLGPANDVGAFEVQGDFSVGVTPSKQDVAPGWSVNFGVQVASVGGFNGMVALSASGLPAGATASFNPTSVLAGGSSTLTVTAGSNTPLGAAAFLVTGTSGIQHSTTATLNVVVSPVRSLSLNPSSVFGGANVSVGTVTLRSAAPAGGMVISLSSNLPGIAAPAVSTITIPSGKTTGTFSITSNMVAVNTSVIITARGGGGGATATLTVKPLLSSVSVKPKSVIGGAQTVSGLVSLAAAAPPGGVTVALSSSQPATASAPATVLVPAGSKTASFTVTTSQVSASTTVILSASLAGVTKTDSLTVKPARQR